jgi:predicted HAD superfamily hydrolase
MTDNRLQAHQPIQRTRSSPINSPRETAQFETLLKLVDVVSFDLFDTLIHREGLFSPKDLFYQVQDLAERELRLRLDAFPSMRIHAEERARVRAWGRGRQETVLDDIYDELGRMLNLDMDVIQRLMTIELACERSGLVALENGGRLVKLALGAGKAVIIITDTYFSEDFVTDIARQTGYTEVKKIYVSSTYGKSKVEGGLYDVVLKDLRCPPNKLLHVGDNQLVDITVALGKGIRAFFVPTPKQQLRSQHRLGDQLSGNLVISRMLCELSSKTAERARDPQSVIAQAATQNLALLYFGYAAWLLERLRDGGYRRVYFAARDGLIMKRFFELVAAADGFEIDSRYLYISRAALYPSLIFTDPPMARRLFAQNWDHLTVEQALQRILLTFDECADALAKHRLAHRKLRVSSANMERFLAFLSDVWPVLESRHTEHYQLTVDYLRQEMLFAEEKTAFVDIGWHGSLQNCLVKLFKHLRISKQLDGYYLGTFEKPIGRSADFNALGFLVDNDEPKSIAHLVRAGPSVIELFHSAYHGSVLGYKRDGTRVVPILENNPEEQQQFLSTIEPLQNRAFEFVSEHLAGRPNAAIQAPDPALVARIALRVIYAPTAAEATTFGGLQIASDFGSRMKSITGLLEWDLRKITGDVLPDHTLPIWRPGFRALKEL